MLTERKQVLGPDDKIVDLVSVTNAPTPPIGTTLHGDVEDLTVEGTGFEDKPRNTILPTIEYADLVVGTTLTALRGVWATQQPITGWGYEWLADGTPIDGATASTFELTINAVDANISVRITATTRGGSVAATSAAVGPVVAGGG